MSKEITYEHCEHGFLIHEEFGSAIFCDKCKIELLQKENAGLRKLLNDNKVEHES